MQQLSHLFCLYVDVQSHFTRLPFLLPRSPTLPCFFPFSRPPSAAVAAFSCVRPTMQLSVHSAKFRNFAVSTLRGGERERHGHPVGGVSLSVTSPSHDIFALRHEGIHS